MTLTTDRWRDSAGVLYTPNTLVTVEIPLPKITAQQWLIGEVTYRLDESGTHADLTLMPPEAYQPEPYNFQPVDRQVYNEVQGGAQKGRGSPDFNPRRGEAPDVASGDLDRRIRRVSGWGRNMAARLARGHRQALSAGHR